MQAIDAESNYIGNDKSNDEHHVSFSVEELFKSYRNKNQFVVCSPVDESWKASIGNFYNGVRTATWLFRGKAYDFANTAVLSLEGYLAKLIFFGYTNSTVVAPSSIAVLKAVSRGSRLNRSSMNIIFEYEKVLLSIIEELNEVVETLSDHIGAKVSRAFINALNDLGSVFFQYMRDFLESCRSFKCKKRINSKSVFKKTIKLMNTLALVGETLLNECESKATLQVYESVSVLHLIFTSLMSAVSGINSCAMDVLYNQSCLISRSTTASLLSFNFALDQVTDATSKITFPFNNTVKDVLTSLVNITLALNTSLKDVYGVFEGVEITVGEIVKDLVGDKVTVSADKAPTKIVKGVVPKPK